MGRPSRTFTGDAWPGLAAVVRRCVDALPARHRQALRMVYWMGAPTAVVANRLGVSSKTVRRWLSQAMSGIQADLAQQGWETEDVLGMVLRQLPPPTEGKETLTARVLLDSRLVGLWRDRKGPDSPEWARTLCEAAQRRGGCR